MKRLMVLLVASLVFIFCNTTASQAITIGFDPASQYVPVGDPVDVELVISGLGDGVAPSLGTFDLFIDFSDSVLSFKSASFGDPVLGDQLDLFGFGFNPTYAGLVQPGVLNLFELSLDLLSDLDMLQPGSFTLATLTFDTLAVGTSSLYIVPMALGDANGDPLDADLLSGSINVVPEPATLLMIGTGLVGLGYFRRRKLIGS